MQGAIAAGHPLTAEAGAGVLREGGNAVDACIAAAFAAFVTEGPLTGPAGGGFLLAHVGGEATMLDCFFAVPSVERLAMEEVVVDFADAGTQVFFVGEGSVAVPGIVPGLVEAHRRLGSAPWTDLIRPAIELARAGYDANEQQGFLHGILATILQRDEGGRRIYGATPRIVTADLVPLLEALQDDPTRAICELLPELGADLAAYRPLDREPVRATVAAHEVLATPSPSRGGAIVTSALPGLLVATSLDERAAALEAAYGTTAPGRITGTTHVSVLDARGDAAALSATLGSGSGVFRRGTQLNNMLGEPDVIGPGEPVAGARLPSMMTPTIVLAEGRPRFVLGSAGSVRLSGAIAQVAASLLHGTPVAEAVDGPRIHVEGTTLHLEGGSQGTAGPPWDVVRWGGRNLFFGGVSAVERRADGSLGAAGDPRRGGHGIVVG